MIWLLATALTTAHAADCETVRFKDIASLEAPAIVVLGERHGHQPDLRRASRLVSRLARDHKVTLGLEAVHQRYQPVLEKFAGGKLDASDLPGLMDWDNSWGFPFKPYEDLVTSALVGVKVVGAGLDLGPKPEDAEIVVPPRYLDLLREYMGGHEVPIASEARFVESMTWRDHRIAELSVDAWKGKGFLVIVTGRGHVEGGKGVAWQAARMSEAPVHAFTLVKGREALCADGDRYWR